MWQLIRNWLNNNLELIHEGLNWLDSYIRQFENVKIFLIASVIVILVPGAVITKKRGEQ